jgi:hypothetical protein
MRRGVRDVATTAAMACPPGMRLLALTAVLASASLASAASAPLAANNPSASQLHTDDCAKATAQHRACVIDMGTGDDIGGEVPAGTGTSVTFVAWTKASSLIQLRRDFITEIIRSAADL